MSHISVKNPTFLGSLKLYNMKKTACFLFFSLLLCAACQTQDDAQKIIDQAIAVHGGKQLEQSLVSFDFRKKQYKAAIDRGLFHYESILEDSMGTMHDALSNKGFSRKINGEEVNLSKEDSDRFQNSLNSVIYFALLPYPLNDPAAHKTLLGETTIKGEPYHEIQVTFAEDGGGTDHEDVYIYWIHQQEKTMDYLAYSFHVNDGGTRFREAYNVRKVEGVRFADYINYESTEENFALEDYATLFEEGKVEELSRIELKNVEVSSPSAKLTALQK